MPRVYPELSTARVLTVENLGGVPLSAVLSPARRAALRLDDSGSDPHALDASLIDATTRRILVHRFYCAGLHPLNLLLLPGDTFTFANFNWCEAVDGGNSLTYTRFLKDVFSTELPRVARAFEELLIRRDFLRERSPARRLHSGESRVAAQRGRFLLAPFELAGGDTACGAAPWLRGPSRNAVRIPRAHAVENVAMRLDPS